MREDVEKAELMGRLCRNVLRCTGGSTSGKEAGAGLLLTGNSLPSFSFGCSCPSLESS